MESIKQTATEWLYEQLTSTWFDKTSGQNILEQAKEMEKEKQKYFFDCGRQYQLTGENTFNEVYNEIYGGENE
jgi:hypothetical protein